MRYIAIPTVAAIVAGAGVLYFPMLVLAVPVAVGVFLHLKDYLENR
jgi:hypothetical protein